MLNVVSKGPALFNRDVVIDCEYWRHHAKYVECDVHGTITAYFDYVLDSMVAPSKVLMEINGKVIGYRVENFNVADKKIIFQWSTMCHGDESVVREWCYS